MTCTYSRRTEYISFNFV